MPAIQTSYPLTQGRFFEGMVPDMRPRTIVSKAVETAAGIGFGKVAVKGTADNQVRVAEAGRPFVGITSMDPTQVSATVDTYPQYAVANVVTKGSVVCTASVTVAYGDPVYFVPATGVLTNVATANTQIVGAKWETTTTAPGQLSVVYLG